MESFEDRIRKQEEALRRFDHRPFQELLKERAMPLPLWAQRPLTDSGMTLLNDLRKAAEESSAPAFCVYAHVPYCRSRCGYCDCYSFPLTPSRLPELPAYADLLCREIAWWGNNVPALRNRSLSTVHFGGGTPMTIGTDGLKRVTDTMRKFFKVDEKTELALESTTSYLNEKTMDELWRMGFTRLHIGVQTLRDPIRKAIGRRESGREVLEKIRYAVSAGWIVSTDVIIGLPGYTEADIHPDIEEMTDAGAEGISIYELVRSSRNRAFFERHGILDPDMAAMWRQFQYAFWLAEKLGYHHLIYNHMVRGRDDNRYFTSPARGEDLLSFGTIADGYFGSHLYKHAELPEYRADVEAGGPGLKGGLLRTERERRFACLEREIRGGNPLPDPFIGILGPEKALELFQNWIAKGYLRVNEDGEGTELLPNGSWFIRKMLDDAAVLMPQDSVDI